MAKSRPRIILSAAISVDGKIATRTGDSKLSSRLDIVRLHKLRSKVDAVLIGKNTALKDDPLLNVRYAKGKDPIRIILDSKGAMPKKSKILQTSGQIPTIVAVSRKISKSNLARLEKFPIEIIFAGERAVNIKSLLRKLYRKKIETVLVEGGGTTNWEFVRQNLFDELVVTVSPVLVGGKDAVSLMEGDGFAKIAYSPDLRLKSTKKLENHLVLHYEKL